MNNLLTAFFVEYPFTIEDLRRPHLVSHRKPYVVEKMILLDEIDYENFITDLCVDRWFIEDNIELCEVDNEGFWHCILVKQRGQPDGVLAMSEGHVFAKWAAYYSNAESL